MKEYVCAVCGYVHMGDEPPEVCTLCGAPQPAFLIFHADEHDQDVATDTSRLTRWTAEALDFRPENYDQPSA